MLAKTVQDAQRKWAASVVANAKSILLRADKVATGNLMNSLGYSLDVRTGDIEFFSASYGEFVEKGRKKGARFPPSDPILRWIKVRGIKGRDKKGRFITDKSLTFLIQRAISRDGIKPLPFFNLAIRRAGGVKALNTAVAEAIKKDIALKVKQALKS
jgi:hypothetical protein